VDAVAAELKKRNPGFDAKVKHALEGDVVIELVFSADHITDLSPVRALTELRSLNCSGTAEDKPAPLADLSPLKGMKLEALSCARTKVTDLSPLKGMMLGFLNCDTTQISDLSPLKGMPMATGHLLIGGTKVSDLSPLKGMGLTNLHCWGTPISDLTPLKGMKLEDLHCADTKVTDLSPLRGMPLEDLHCDFEPKRDTEILRSLTKLMAINGKPAAQFWKEVDATSPPPRTDAIVQKFHVPAGGHQWCRDER